MYKNVKKIILFIIIIGIFFNTSQVLASNNWEDEYTKILRSSRKRYHTREERAMVPDYYDLSKLKFKLLDMDGDNIPELIIWMDNWMLKAYDIFTFKNGNVNNLVRSRYKQTGWDIYYSEKDKSIYTNDISTMSSGLNRLKLHNNKLSEELILYHYEGDYHPAKGTDYYEYKNKRVSKEFAEKKLKEISLRDAKYYRLNDHSIKKGISDYKKDNNIDISIILDGKEIELSESVRTINGTTYYPFREILEKTGANISWNQKMRIAEAELDGRKVGFKIDTSDYWIDGRKNTLKNNIKPFLSIDNKSFIPIRYAMEALNYDVDWNGNNRVITIDRISK